MNAEEAKTAELLQQFADGDEQALRPLLERHRSRLLQMVRLRMDAKLAARIDASDVVQEALTAASERIEDYMRERPLPFYPWLRELAWNRLVELHQKQRRAQRRNVGRQGTGSGASLDPSLVRLANRLAANDSSARSRMLRREVRDRMHLALETLSPRDREILILLNLEEHSVGEAAAILGVTKDAARQRQLRALKRLHRLLGTG